MRFGVGDFEQANCVSSAFCGSAGDHAFPRIPEKLRIVRKEREKPMKRSMSWAAMVGMAVLISVPLAAQSVSTAGVKGQAGSDPHVKSDSANNPEHPKVPAPPSKGGPKSRGLNGTCNIHVDNRTPYYITFYFDGNPAGALGPWGDLMPNITQGVAEIYAKAVFTNGSVLTFGPRDLRCTGGDFTWTLTP